MSDLAFILSLYPTDCRPTQFEALGNAGGMSGAQFWRIHSPRGTLVLRQWPREHPAADRLRLIHAVLDHAARRGITFLPVPIRATTGESFVQHAGHLWELAPWVPGAADFERTPSSQKLQAAMQALAKFHVAVADFERERYAPPPAITRRLEMLQELQSGSINRLAHAVTDTNWPELAPLAHQFLAALPAALPRAIAQLAPLAEVSLPLQPCLRDIWHDHVQFTGNEVTGIIDFGAVDIDTPATDVARLLGSLGTVPLSPVQRDRSQFPIDEDHSKTAKRGLSPSPRDDAATWQIGLNAYSVVRPLSADELRAVTAFDTSGTLLAGVNWLRWIYVEGRQFENQTQVIERFRKIVARSSN